MTPLLRLPIDPDHGLEPLGSVTTVVTAETAIRLPLQTRGGIATNVEVVNVIAPGETANESPVPVNGPLAATMTDVDAKIVVLTTAESVSYSLPPQFPFSRPLSCFSLHLSFSYPIDLFSSPSSR